MTIHFEFGTLYDLEEGERLGAILCQCFNFPTTEWQRYSSRIGLENFRVVRDAGEVVGGLAIYRMGQWFGEASIPMAGIATVGVAPEYRGTGVAAELMAKTVKQLHADGVPLSALYAATQRLYRKVGYEQAGNYCRFALQVGSIRLCDRALPMRRVEASRHEVFHELYRQRAIATNGNLDRNAAIWENIVQPEKEEVIHAYMVGPDDRPEGYVIFTQEWGDSGYNLKVRDLVALTPAAGRRIWTFFADHSTQADSVLWRGPSVEPLLYLLPEQTYRIVDLERWLLRVVDVPLGLENRGYPAAVEAELHLRVQDDLLPENNGLFLLRISGGRGEVTRGGRGDLQLDVRGLATLYTGLFTPHQLQLIGQLEASDSALTTATQLFAGSEPWMPDFF